MRRIGMLVLAGLALTACGGSKHQLTPQEKKDEAKAEQTIKRCLPGGDLLTLATSKPARVKFLNCAIPDKNRVAAEHCATSGILGHLPTKSRVESVLLECVGRYA